MPNQYTIVLVLLFFVIGIDVYAQSEEDSHKDSELSWFVSSSVGYQMSGIKSEDFIRSNYSPLFKLSAGRWFSDELALQIGYQGFYYRTISDDQKHYYNYFFGEAIFDMHNLFQGKDDSRFWSLLVHGGSGYFLNNSTNQPNIIAATIAVNNNFRLTQNFSMNVQVSAIMGWDIYQGNEDILPGLSVGITHIF